MRYLPPLPLKRGYMTGVEAETQRIFDHFIFAPLQKALANPTKEIRNSVNVLMDTIRDGKVWYDDGYFYGEFNAVITKQLKELGAVYERAYQRQAKDQRQAARHHNGRFKLEKSLVPADMGMVFAAAEQRFSEVRHAFLETLEDIDIESIREFSRTKDKYREAINWMEGDFQKTVKSITIEVKLTDSQRDMIANQWGENLDVYIQQWTGENILNLRQQVQAMTFSGRQTRDIIELIQNNYGVSQRKAKFLAHQETSLLLSKFRQTRYQDAGIQKYRWSTSHDERVRRDHKVLNGTIQTWDQPPVTDRNTGKRNHPGEDWGCRCVAVAIVE